MATLRITHNGITADRDIEPPRVNWLHSVGGAQYVPTHDRHAHAAGLSHECSRVRSGREYTGQIENPREARRAIIEQYAGHTLIWIGDWS